MSRFRSAWQTGRKAKRCQEADWAGRRRSEAGTAGQALQRGHCGPQAGLCAPGGPPPLTPLGAHGCPWRILDLLKIVYVNIKIFKERQRRKAVDTKSPLSPVTATLHSWSPPALTAEPHRTRSSPASRGWRVGVSDRFVRLPRELVTRGRGRGGVFPHPVDVQPVPATHFDCSEQRGQEASLLCAPSSVPRRTRPRWPEEGFRESQGGHGGRGSRPEPSSQPEPSLAGRSQVNLQTRERENRCSRRLNSGWFTMP